jgi:hypothetical protein
MGPAISGVVLYKTVGPLYYLNLPQPLPYYDNPGRLRNDALAGKFRWIIVRRRDRAALAASLGVPVKTVASEEAFPFESGQHVLNKEMMIAVPTAAAGDETHP